MIDLGSWVASLASIGVPAVHGLVLTSPFDLRFDPAKPAPLCVAQEPPLTFGTVTEAWVSDQTLMASGRLVVDDQYEQLADVMIEAMRSGALVPGFELHNIAGEVYQAGSPRHIAAGELGPVFLRPSFLASWPICRFEVHA